MRFAGHRGFATALRPNADPEVIERQLRANLTLRLEIPSTGDITLISFARQNARHVVAKILKISLKLDGSEVIKSVKAFVHAAYCGNAIRRVFSIAQLH